MDLRALALGLVFALMWSSAFSSARIIVTEAPPFATLALRFALSGALAVGIAWYLGQRPNFTPAQWRALVIFGICQNALYLGLNFLAMQHVEASLAAIIASSLPLLVALAGQLGFGGRLNRLAWLGLFAGLAGVLVIMGARLTGGADAGGVALCVLGALALMFATLAVKGTGSGGNVLMAVGAQMAIGSLALLPAALLFEADRLSLGWPSMRLAAAFTYTTLVPGLAATVVWFRLVNRVGAARAATFHFLNPVFGVAIAAVILGESVSVTDAVGIVIVAAGILVVQRQAA